MARKWIVGILTATLLVALLGCQGEPRGPQVSKLGADARILAFGDSLTYGTGVTESDSYPRVLESLLGREVIRSGIPGEVSSAGLLRLPEELDRYQPQLVVLLHGGNDILRRHAPNSTYNNLRSMIELIRSRGIEVVLIGVPGFSLMLQAPSADTQYDKVAEELAVPYDGESLPALLYDNQYKSDSIHLNVEGYRLLATAIRDLLERAGAL